MEFKSILVLIFLVAFVSANGINVENSIIEINKTNGIDAYYNITIQNQQPEKLFNISATNIFIFDKLDIEPGENVIIEAKIITNEEFNGQVKLIGDYFEEDLGVSNKTETATIDTSGLDLCNLDLTRGDTIIWKNNFLGEVKLRNLNTGEYFATIQGSTDYTHYFGDAVEFDYQVYKIGLPFSQVCHINIRPTSGYIHSSEFDKILDVKINIEYEPTEIKTTILGDYYNISYNQQVTDTIKVENIGSKLAKVKMYNKGWFYYSDNQFDLQPGESKNIDYIIQPFIYQTNQTGITYDESITIEGNFETKEIPISIFVKHKTFAEVGNSTYDKEYALNFVNLFCSVYPDDCPNTIIYTNESDRNVTFSVNEETYKQKVITDDENWELVKNILNIQNEKLEILENKTEEYVGNSNQTSKDVGRLSDKTEELLGTIIFAGIMAVFIAIVVIFGLVLLKERRRLKLTKVFHKRELPW